MYSGQQAVGQAPRGASTTWSTAKPGYDVRSGAARKLSVSTIRSAVTITVRAAFTSSLSNHTSFGLTRALPSTSASCTWTTATSGASAAHAR